MESENNRGRRLLRRTALLSALLLLLCATLFLTSCFGALGSLLSGDHDGPGEEGGDTDPVTEEDRNWRFTFQPDDNGEGYVLTEAFYIGDGTEFDLTVPASYNGKNVTGMNSNLFESRNLGNVVIPGTVTTIPSGAFRHSTVKSVTFGEGLVHIEDDAFAGCASLASVSIPDTISSVGARAFEHCESLTSVVFPGGVGVIGEYAFGDCHNLQELNLGTGVLIIEANAFYNATALQRVIIPSVEKWMSIQFRNETASPLAQRGHSPAGALT